MLGDVQTNMPFLLAISMDVMSSTSTLDPQNDLLTEQTNKPGSEDENMTDLRTQLLELN